MRQIPGYSYNFGRLQPEKSRLESKCFALDIVKVT